MKEEALFQALKRHGIEAQRDFRIGRYTYDFFIPDGNILVEYRGCFWHGHDHVKMPRGGMLGRKFWHDKIKNNRRKDRMKERLAALSGLPLIIVWECGKLEIVISESRKISLS
jgi:G:T-mismatch repair DNA endonuclease (very short patch repair protein)